MLAHFPPTAAAQSETTGKEHGRLETRRLWAKAVLSDDIGFYGARQIVRIERTRHLIKSGTLSKEESLFITSLKPLQDPAANAARLLMIARDHWSIENGSHHMRDRTYDEDRCQVRHPNAAQVLATLRNLAGFLAHRGAHHPRSSKQHCVPALNRYASARTASVIHWILKSAFLTP